MKQSSLENTNLSRVFAAAAARDVAMAPATWTVHSAQGETSPHGFGGNWMWWKKIMDPWVRTARSTDAHPGEVRHLQKIPGQHWSLPYPKPQPSGRVTQLSTLHLHRERPRPPASKCLN